MSDRTVLGAFFAATIVVAGGTAWAASTPTPPSAPEASAATKAFGKLSVDGSRAFQDLNLTRLALYDGKIDQAKALVGKAAIELSKAQNDDSVFMKDERQLMTAEQIGAKSTTRPTQATTDGATQNAQDRQDTEVKPVAWLPVDGAISLNEDYSLNPTKKQAVADANKSLAKGDRAGAMDKLKLADVDMTVSLEVVPIKQTISDVAQATQMIDAGKYYEGGQVLRKAQMAARYDITDIVATPKTAGQ